MKTSHIIACIILGVFIYVYLFVCFGFDSKCRSRWEKWFPDGPQPMNSGRGGQSHTMAPPVAPSIRTGLPYIPITAPQGSRLYP